jgi:hypothetical protein
VADVGAILRARTKDNNGSEVGTFTADSTRPNEAQVQALIAMAVNDVAAELGADIPSPCQVDARTLAATRAAMKVELSYFPEQIGNDRSPYRALKDEWDAGVKRVARCIQNTNSGGDDGGAGPSRPRSSFPMQGDPFLIGRGTAW